MLNSSKVHSLNQEFHYADPHTVLQLYSIYICYFYGSNLWDFNSVELQRLFNSWNVSIRILFDLPRETYRYFIEQLFLGHSILKLFHVPALYSLYKV